jgi:hypothetical protein
MRWDKLSHCSVGQLKGDAVWGNLKAVNAVKPNKQSEKLRYGQSRRLLRSKRRVMRKELELTKER